MSTVKDPFETSAGEETADDFMILSQKPAALTQPPVAALSGAATARFHGFDLDDQPLVVDLPNLPGEIVLARTTIELRRRQIGATVVVLFEHGDIRRPIVVGILREPLCRVATVASARPQLVQMKVDDDQVVLSAEREIVMRCGRASITLTRSGKVIIKGSYIVSDSTGCNRIKGAAVDIN
jgi:Domain of unknown function (DUF6484)